MRADRHWINGASIAGAALLVCIWTSAKGAQPQPVEEEHPALSVSADVGALSSYWWRGWLVTDRMTLQPSATLAWETAGFEVTAWGSAALVDRDRLGSADEIDLILGYSRPFGLADRDGAFDLGYTQYLFTAVPDSTAHTEEMMLSLSLDTRLAPSLTFSYDLGLYDEAYIEAAIGPEIALSDGGGTAFLLEANVGAGSFGEPFGFRNAQAEASLRVKAGPLTLAPKVGYGYALSGPNRAQDRRFAGLSVIVGE
jgi:Bacterial protein of unknown function (Gcw_chp)